MASTTKKTTVKKKTTIKESRKAAFTARTEKEITATFLDGVGLTAKVASTLAAENVNILAGTGYSASGFRRMATFTLIVDDLEKAEKALYKIGADNIQDQSVILVETENQPGALEEVSSIIAKAGIAIYYFYATTSSGKTATSVFKTANDKKAIKALSKA
ncbi:MAG: hypothetical protein ISR96_09630 [Nitrospira sp.]|nr:hypothetical protein [bacterium]MBL7049760.1 hypothetical protein [Nitrospira sp.]